MTSTTATSTDATTIGVVPLKDAKDSWLWDWRTKSPDASSHGGSLFRGSRETSGHGGKAFSGMGNRKASFSDMAGGPLTDDPSRQIPRSREASGHGGNHFGGLFKGGLMSLNQPSPNGVGGLRKNASWVWDWATGSPNSTPSNSAHGGTHFAKAKGPEFDSQGDPTVQKLGVATGGNMKRSLSFLWDWDRHRADAPQTPGNSQHGGSQFATEDTAEKEADEDEAEEGVAITPPAAMQRNLSLGSLRAFASPPAISTPSKSNPRSHPPPPHACAQSGTGVRVVPRHRRLPATRNTRARPSSTCRISEEQHVQL